MDLAARSVFVVEQFVMFICEGEMRIYVYLSIYFPFYYIYVAT